jgi:redox-sensitive bicupin YhaK (pirin superfamily)
MIDGTFAYEDSTGKAGVLPAGTLGWLRAGAGAWHAERSIDGECARGFQLWIALPPELEHAQPDSQYVSPDEVETEGPVRVILGKYGVTHSPVRSPQSLNYLHIHLLDGERWDYQPPAGHTVAWAFPYEGKLRVPDAIEAGELVIFEESNSALTFAAEGDTEFLLGSSIQHPHDLVLGYYAVHTSVDALARGRLEVERTGRRMLESGKLDEAQLQTALERIRPGNW